MCGICGFVGQGELPDLQKMNQAMIHRGPDAEGYWYDHDVKVYLGHRRLSIIDLSDGIQPMLTMDGELVVSFNGEIYNHIELRQELENKGHIFKTDHSDTEVLLYGFREWGSELPNKLNGMWAFVIYDKSKKNLFLSRDRFGEKPLYYTLQNGTFAFASELSALIKHSSIITSVSSRSLKKYFAYGFIPAPNSLYRNVHKLPGGYNLFFNIDNLTLKAWKYWDFVLEPFEHIPKNPIIEWGERLRDLLERSIKRRLMSDVPIGVFLSGGIDSSALTAFASKILGIKKLKTFSVGFQEESFDESRYAQEIANTFHTEHYLEMLSMENAREFLPEIISKIDEPIGDSSILPTYLLCRETKKHVTVALGGDGSDELFAGYDPFHALRLSNLYSKIIPRPLHRAISIVINKLPVSHRNISLDFKLKRTIRGMSYPKQLWNPVWLGPLEPKELNELFLEPIDIEDVYSEAIEYWESCLQDNLVDKTLQFYTKLYLQDDILAKVDRASMMHSLEVRAPYLDIELVDFVRKIPSEYKFRNGQTKYILKKALEPVLPHNILYRHKKGFGVPIGKWFQDGSLKIRNTPLLYKLNHNFLHKKIQEHIQGTKDHKLLLWNLLLLESQGSIKN